MTSFEESQSLLREEFLEIIQDFRRFVSIVYSIMNHEAIVRYSRIPFSTKEKLSGLTKIIMDYIDSLDSRIKYIKNKWKPNEAFEFQDQESPFEEYIKNDDEEEE